LAQFSTRQSELLTSARVGHLATADENARPHVIPVCFATDGRYIYSVLDKKPKRTALTRLRRVKNILANPQATLLVDHYEEDWGNLWYLMVSGQAELLIDGQEQIEALVLLRNKYHQYREMDIGLNPVIKITPENIVSWGREPHHS
jgi:PPOX class probable F420-dependent enzyme